MNLNQSIRQILLACATAAFAASSLAAVGIQNPPPGPGMVPDYFGVTGNYANSPQPVLATITITDSAGTGAVAALAPESDAVARCQQSQAGGDERPGGGHGIHAGALHHAGLVGFKVARTIARTDRAGHCHIGGDRGPEQPGRLERP